MRYAVGLSQVVRVLALLALILVASPNFARADDPYQGLPAGAGRDAVLDTCTACHTASIILQNRMSRDQWDALITWMQEKQGLWELEPQVRTAILDYLTRVRGPQPFIAPQGEATPHANPMYEFHYAPNPL